MKAVYAIQRIIFRITTIGAGAAAAALALHVGISVLLRLFQVPTLGTVEYIQFLYMPAASLGAAAAAQLGYEHITVNLLGGSLRGRVLVAARLLVLGLMLVLAVALAVAAFHASGLSLSTGEAGRISGVPIWPAKVLLGVGFSLLAAMALLQLLDRRTYETTPDSAVPAEVVKEQRTEEVH